MNDVDVITVKSEMDNLNSFWNINLHVNSLLHVMHEKLHVYIQNLSFTNLKVEFPVETDQRKVYQYILNLI